MIQKCIIVEDEPLAQEIIKGFISKIPTLELVGTCSSAIEAITFLHSQKIDLLFLDVTMPDLNGIQFLKSLNNPPKVILTTAYSEFAVEAFELGVLDYLIKPFSFERFLKAINRSMTISEEINSNEPEIPTFIFIKVDKKNVKVMLDSILFAEAYGNYVKIHTNKQTYLTTQTFTNFEKVLPEALFIRVHKSYIVQIEAITKVESQKLFIDFIEIPIGITYKHEVEKRF